MCYEVSYVKFNTVLMFKINIVTSIICLYTSPVPEACFSLSGVEELTELTVR